MAWVRQNGESSLMNSVFSNHFTSPKFKHITQHAKSCDQRTQRNPMELDWSDDATSPRMIGLWRELTRPILFLLRLLRPRQFSGSIPRSQSKLDRIIVLVIVRVRQYGESSLMNSSVSNPRHQRYDCLYWEHSYPKGPE